MEQGDLTMSAIKTSQQIGHDRRSFLRNAALTLAAAELAATGSADSQSSEGKAPQIKAGTNTSFGPLKQIDAGLLNVGYAEAGPANGPAGIVNLSAIHLLSLQDVGIATYREPKSL
jgi:hypothetical protein